MRGVVLCWGLVKQARHQHMSYEYKIRFIIGGPPPPSSRVKVRDTIIMVPSELNKEEKVKRTNTGLPNTPHIRKLRKQS